MLARRKSLLQIVGCVLAFLGCLCTASIAPLLFPARAFAASSPMTVLSETQSVSFPGSITFQLQAHDSITTITTATLFLSSDDPQYISELHPVTIAQPSTTVNLTYHEDTTASHFIVPGTLLKYYWELADSTGTYDLPKQQFTTSDTRYNWQQLTQGNVQLNWYNHAADFGQAVLSQEVASVDRISKTLGGQPPHPLHLWVYQTDSDFRGALPPGSYEWVGGIAFPSLSEAFIVVNGLSDETLIRDMPHELTHLVFHQLTAQGIQAPTWFDEGLAVYNQVYHEPEMALRFKQALTAHALISLQKLYFEFPADADQAYLAYAQSWNLVSYMYQTFGQRKMAQLIKDMNNAKTDFQQDLTQAIGENSNHLENQWHLSLHQPATLQPGLDTSPATQSNAALTHISTTDSNAPFYMTLGILLVLVPLLGLVLLFGYQRRLRTSLAKQATTATSVAYPIYPQMRATLSAPPTSPTSLTPTYTQMGSSIPPVMQQQAPQPISHIPDVPYTDPSHYAESQHQTAFETGQTYWGQQPPQHNRQK